MIDGISNIAFKSAVKINTVLFRQVFEACIKERTFPGIWKAKRLVLIAKHNEALDASGYRPFCMIDTLGRRLVGSPIWFPESTFENK